MYFHPIGSNVANVAGEIELYVYANNPQGNATNYADIYNYTLIISQKNNPGWALLAAGLETHELGHVLGLNHTFVEYTISSDADTIDAVICPYYGEGFSVCNEDPNPNIGDDDNNTCDSPISRSVPLASHPDVVPQNNCQGGIGVSNAAWAVNLCSSPEEIGSNIMSYCYGGFGHHISACQLKIMHDMLDNYGSGYFVDTVPNIWPNVAINEGTANYNSCSIIDQFCEESGTLVTLDAGNHWGNNAIYAWSTGATTQTIMPITPNGADTYSVTVTNSSGCSGSDAIVVAGPPAEVGFNADTIEYCIQLWNGNSSIGYILAPDVISSNVVSYNWELIREGAINWEPCTYAPDYYTPYPSSATEISVYLTGLYRLTVTTANGCTASDVVYMLMHVIPYPEITPQVINVGIAEGGLASCEGTPITANVVPGTNIWGTDINDETPYASYLWSNGDTGTSSTFSPGDSTIDTLLYNSPLETYGFYSVTVTDVFGCSGTGSTWFTFVDKPEISFTGDTTLCETAITTIGTVIAPPSTGYGTVLEHTYIWSNGSTTPSITVGPGTYTVTVSQTTEIANQHEYTCSNTASVTVSIGAPILPEWENTVPDSLCLTDAPIDLTQLISNYSSVIGGEFTFSSTTITPPINISVSDIFDPAQLLPDIYKVTYVLELSPFCVAESDMIQIAIYDCSELGCIAQQNYLSFGGSPNFTAPADADALFTTWSPASNPFGAGLGTSANPVMINGTITIPEQSEISIENMNFVFGPNGRVDVQRRGKLTIKGGVFEGDPHCNTMWQGFRVWGPGVNSTVPFNEGGEQLTAGGVIHTGMLLLDIGTVPVVIRDAIIGIATTRLDNYDFNTIANNLAAFNIGAVPFALNASSVTILPQIVGANNASAKGFGGGWLHIRKSAFARFENCFYGTLYTHYKGSSYIVPASLPFDGINGYKIYNATFTSNGNLRFPFTSESTEIGVAGINVTKVRLSVIKSSFENLNYGMRSNDLRTQTIEGNTFNSCLHGISSQVSLLSSSQMSEIMGNTFNSCRLSIQGDALQTMITRNTINGIGGGGEQSVGIFMRDSDYSIGGGTKDMPGNFINDVMIGIAVMGGTEDPNAMISPEIKNNTINRTSVAIHTINENSALDISCNQLINYQRGISVRSFNGITGLLKDQGNCGENKPAFNTFLPIAAPNNTFDLFADAASNGFKYSDIGASALTDNNPTPLSIISKIDCIENLPTCNTYQPGNLGKLIDNTTDAKTKYKILSEWFRKYQADSNYVEAVALLEQNTALPVATLKLIQEYYETENYSSADALLEGLDRSRLETQQFYTLQKLLMQLKQEGKNYSEITAAQEATLLDIANSHTSVGYRAQAILYQARGYEFPVIIPLLDDEYTYTVFKHDNSHAISPFAPNPSNSQTSLQYNLDDQQNATLKVYDMNGRTVNSATLKGKGEYVLDSRYLNSGLYMYIVTVDGVILMRDKLVIIK